MAGRHRRGYDKNVFRSLTMITQFGINMLVPICAMSALGIYLDKRFDTSFWMIVLFAAGAIAGGQNVYRAAKQIYAPSQEAEESRGGQEGKEPPLENEDD